MFAPSRRRAIASAFVLVTLSAGAAGAVSLPPLPPAPPAEVPPPSRAPGESPLPAAPEDAGGPPVPPSPPPPPSAPSEGEPAPDGAPGVPDAGADAAPIGAPVQEAPYEVVLPPEEPAVPVEQAPNASLAPDHPADQNKPIQFFKGELIHPGTRELLSRYDHFGVALGPRIIGTDLFLGVSPGLALYTDWFALAAHVPLNLLALESGTYTYGGLRVRREDWDEVPDFAKVLRFFTIGRDEDFFYLSVNTMRPTTVGHGMMIDKYQPNMDVDRSMTGLLFEAYNDYGGFELQLNDVTFTNRIIGGLAFVKPLSFFSDNMLLKSLSLGGEYFADMRAPRCVLIRPGGDECVRATGHAAGADPFTGELADDTFVRTDSDTGRYAVKEDLVHAAGFSGEVKLYKDEHNVDIKLYSTYHQFLNEGGGNGNSVGLLGRFNAGSGRVHAFRVRTEYRTFTDGFVPSYFDTLYEVNKYEYTLQKNAYQAQPTKWQAVFGDEENGFARSRLGRRHGYNLEGSWGVFAAGRGQKRIALGFGLQDANGPHDTHAFAHLELPALQWLQIFATYMRTNEAQVADLFNRSFDVDNAVILTGLRLQVLPILFINAHYSSSFRVVRSPGSEYHLGGDTVVDGAGNPSPFFGRDRLYENVPTLFVELELGYEFDGDDAEPEEARDEPAPTGDQP